MTQPPLRVRSPGYATHMVTAASRREREIIAQRATRVISHGRRCKVTDDVRARLERAEAERDAATRRAEAVTTGLDELLDDLRKATDKDFSLGLMRVRVKALRAALSVEPQEAGE